MVSALPAYAHRSSAGEYRTVNSVRSPRRKASAGCATTDPATNVCFAFTTHSDLQWITTWSANVLNEKSEGMSILTISPGASGCDAKCVVS